MRYFSTRDKTTPASFAAAALGGLAPDGGLYVPEELPRYRAAVLSSLSSLSFQELAFESIRPFVHPEMPDAVLQEIVHAAFNFDCPLVQPENGAYTVLELFHGPTAAFKDFGARFMARAFSYLRRGETRPLHILVATSGDTGGAVADGFFGVEGIDVTVLYPKGRVSDLQERQIAGLGGNVRALAVEGSFDDCQRLVKEAFVSEPLKNRAALSSANSINIARLIPQTVYYAHAAARHPGAVIVVPSGNLGNLTAGLYAHALGAPLSGFIAATNRNKTFAEYIQTGHYTPRDSVATISNAMDVGAPSNFERITSHWPHSRLAGTIAARFADDVGTRQTIANVFHRHNYVLDPHGAVGWEAARMARKTEIAQRGPLVIMETAHPAKFAAVVEPLCGAVPLPASLQAALRRTVSAQTIPARTAVLVDALTQE